MGQNIGVNGFRHAASDSTLPASTGFDDIPGMYFSVSAGVYNFDARLIIHQSGTPTGIDFAVYSSVQTQLNYHIQRSFNARGLEGQDIYGNDAGYSINDFAASSHFLVRMTGVIRTTGTGIVYLRYQTDDNNLFVLKQGSNLESAWVYAQ